MYLNYLCNVGSLDITKFMPKEALLQKSFYTTIFKILVQQFEIVIYQHIVYTFDL